MTNQDNAKERKKLQIKWQELQKDISSLPFIKPNKKRASKETICHATGRELSPRTKCQLEEKVFLVDYLISNNFTEEASINLLKQVKSCIDGFRKEFGQVEATKKKRYPLCLNCFVISVSGRVSIDATIATNNERIEDFVKCERENILSPISTPECILKSASNEDMDSDLWIMGVLFYLCLSPVEKKRYPFNWSENKFHFIEAAKNGIDKIISDLERNDLSVFSIDLVKNLLAFDVITRRTSLTKF